jgi:hypothetical protein
LAVFGIWFDGNGCWACRYFAGGWFEVDHDIDLNVMECTLVSV